MLRNSGQAWLKSTIRDITLTSLMEGSGLDLQALYSRSDLSEWGLLGLVQPQGKKQRTHAGFQARN